MDRRSNWADGLHRHTADSLRKKLLPALAAMLIGLGLVFRNGVAVVLGLITAVLAFFVTASLVLTAWVYGSEWILRWASS